MKIFVILATVLASALAKPGVIAYNGYPFGATTYNTGYFGYAAAPAVTYAAAPAVTYAAAPAVTYAAAPAVTYAAAPAVTYAAAPAVTYAAAPAVTYATAPAPAFAYTAPAIVAPAFTKTQYHAQDELGQASFGHAHEGQAHSAIRDAFGNVRGAYAYINPEGKEIRVAYTAGVGGVQVESNALPEAPVHVLPEPLVAPLPVADTPEVVEARDAHLKAVEEAKTRNAAAEQETEEKAEEKTEEKAEEASDSGSETEKTGERKKRGIFTNTVAAPVVTYATSYSNYAVIPAAVSSSYRYDAPKVKSIAYIAAAAPIVKAVAPAPIVKTYAVAAPVAKVVYAARPYASYYSPLLGSSLYGYAAPYSSFGYYGYGYPRVF